jgi:hypothetical protein
MDKALGRLQSSISKSRPSIALAVTATGSRAPDGAPLTDPAVKRALAPLDPSGELAEGIVPGGLFVDQGTLTEEDLTEDEIVTAVRDMRRNGARVFADAFPSLAVSFARYC